jgi:hypothetical protein
LWGQREEPGSPTPYRSGRCCSRGLSCPFRWRLPDFPDTL